MAIRTQVAAQLKALATAGDIVAKTLVENVQDIKLTAGAEASDVIKVTGQMLDGVGNPKAGVQNVLVKSYPVAGAGTMADGGAGTVKKGAASTEVWMETDATGKFELDVSNVNAEDNLIVAQSADGDVAMLKLTFA